MVMAGSPSKKGFQFLGIPPKGELELIYLNTQEKSWVVSNF